MPNSPSANPTPITPPRVPMLDPRTGLIDRAWYMFFLSLFTTASNAQDPALGLDTSSLLASFDAELRALSDEVGTLYDAESSLASLAASLAALEQQFALQPSSEVGELTQQINNLRQELETQRQPDLGTMAPLQQDNVPWFTFNTAPSPVPTAVGSMYWDGGTTMGIQATTNVLIRVGESEYVYVKASSAITKGQLCYHTGAVGASGVITVAPTPLALTDPNQIVGIAAETIPLNGFGLIQISGDLRGFNTTGSSVGETWADGDPLYYNPAYVGSMTKTKPSAPNQKTYVGEVINAATAGSGSMNIRIVPGSVLGGTDSNVQFGTLANYDLIQYDSGLQYWKNVSASSIAIGTATNLAGGAAGSVPYQSSASTTTFLPIGTALQVLKVNAGATAPQWVSGAALTKTDDTNVTLTLGGSPTTALLAATSLTLGWTGTLAVGRGGLGISTTPSNGFLPIGNGTNYTAAALTAGTGITITNAAGSVTIAATAGGGSAPITKTANFSVANGESWYINNKTGSACTVTLPAASSFTGRELTFVNYQAQTLISASSNVVPLGGGSAGTAILAASVGDWATLVSDGTNWIIMQAAANNCLLLE